MKAAEQIIRRMLVTEKGTRLRDAHRQYQFEVSPDANKMEIRRAVEQLFRVHVTDVRTLWRRGKWKRGRTQHAGRTTSVKRALVTLRADEKIELT